MTEEFLDYLELSDLKWLRKYLTGTAVKTRLSLKFSLYLTDYFLFFYDLILLTPVVNTCVGIQN